MVVVTQQRGRKVSGRTRRRRTRRVLGRMRRQAAHGVLGRIHLGTAGNSPRLRRWALAVVLLGVVLVPYPTQGAVGALPAVACRAGCGAGSCPAWSSGRPRCPGSWDVVSGLTGTVPASGLAYVSVGDGVAAVGVGLTVYGYSSKTGASQWRDTLTGFPAGAAIVSVRTWPGEVTAGVSYRPRAAPPLCAYRGSDLRSGGRPDGPVPGGPVRGGGGGQREVHRRRRHHRGDELRQRDGARRGGSGPPARSRRRGVPTATGSTWPNPRAGSWTRGR